VKARTTAIILAAASALYFLWAAEEEPPEWRRFFGLWRVRDLIIGCSLIVGGIIALSAAISRRALSACLFVGWLGVSAWMLLELIGLLGFVSYPERFGRKTGPTLGDDRIVHADVRGVSYHDTAASWGLLSQPVPFHFKTDRRGFRNRHDRARADLYLLGDSIIVAGLISIEKTVTARLERLLGRSAMSVALNGVSPQEEIELFREADLAVENSLVLHFLFEGNDLLDSASHRKGSQEVEAPITESILKKSFAHSGLLWLQQLSQPVVGRARRQMCSINGRQYTFGWIDTSFRGLEPEMKVIQAAMEAFRDEVEDEGGSYAVVFVPAKLRVLGPLCSWPAGSRLENYRRHLGPMQDAVRRWSTNSGVRLIDLTERLGDAAEAGDIPWFWGDSHWNETGHRIAAQSIAAWDVLSEWRFSVDQR
jgi:hypothetical protein